MEVSKETIRKPGYSPHSFCRPVIFEVVRSLTGIISLVGDPPGSIHLLLVEFLGPSLYWLMRQDVVCDPVAT